MWWKIALLVLVVAAIAYVGHLYIKSLKDFAKITESIKNNEEKESENEIKTETETEE